jgi:hypothetical protein
MCRGEEMNHEMEFALTGIIAIAALVFVVYMALNYNEVKK